MVETFPTLGELAAESVLVPQSTVLFLTHCGWPAFELFEIFYAVCTTYDPGGLSFLHTRISFRFSFLLHSSSHPRPSTTPLAPLLRPSFHSLLSACVHTRVHKGLGT